MYSTAIIFLDIIMLEVNAFQTQTRPRNPTPLSLVRMVGAEGILRAAEAAVRVGKLAAQREDRKREGSKEKGI